MPALLDVVSKDTRSPGRHTYLGLEVNWFKAPALKLHYRLELLIVFSLERKYVRRQVQLGPQDNPIAPTLSAKQVLTALVSLEWDLRPTHLILEEALATCSP